MDETWLHRCETLGARWSWYGYSIGAELVQACGEIRRLTQALETAEIRAKDARDLKEALERLASTEGFEGAGIIDGNSFAERELRARGEFARAVLDQGRKRIVWQRPFTEWGSAALSGPGREANDGRS